MAHYTASIETPRPPAETFAYLSDFSTTEQWDPGVVEAQRIGDAPVGRGDRVPARRRLPRPQDRTHLPDRRVRAGRSRHAAGRERDRRLARQDHVRAVRRRDAGHLRRRPRAEGATADRRPAPRARVRARRRPRARRPARDARQSRPGDGCRRLSGRSLDGRHHQLPDDLRAQHTFIVAAFRREQQALVDEWLPWLVDLEERRPDVAVYELPVLSSAYSPARWFIDGGMARGVGTDAARARTITVYTDVGEGRARTRTARHRHDRRPARRPLGPHPRPRTRRLRRREDDAAHRGARALERRRLNVAARSSARSLGTTSASDRQPPSLAREAGALADR